MKKNHFFGRSLLKLTEISHNSANLKKKFDKSFNKVNEIETF